MSDFLADKAIEELRSKVWASVVDTDEIDSDYFTGGADGYDCGVVDALEAAEEFVREFLSEL